MIPAARVAAAIDIIDRWLSGADGLDHVLARWGRENRYAGSGDRHAIADLTYDAVRNLSSACWVAGAVVPSGRSALIGRLWLSSATVSSLDDLFSGARFAPEPLSESERAGLGRDLSEAPPHVRADLPEWLMAELSDDELSSFSGLGDRAPLDLRVNLLKSDRDCAISALEGDGVAAGPGPLSETCLRVTDGARKLRQSRAYLDGLVEVQDAASQAVVDFCRVQPGMTVLDYCAGGGGKALALAALLGGEGFVSAYDSSSQRLAQIAPRAQRAGAVIEIIDPGKLSQDRQFDLVLVDAPCSGSGAWRRNPDAKWHLTRDDLDRLSALQAEVFSEAIAHVKPGGQIVYATCSLLNRENREQAEAFSKNFVTFQRDTRDLSLTLRDGGDGFFATRFRSV